MPAFSDSLKYPTGIVARELAQADWKTGGSCWGGFELGDYSNIKRMGMFYLAAHYIVSMYGNDASDITKVNPEARLNVASQTVGDESVSYRISAIEPTVTDFLSTTIYGTRYLELLQNVSAGIWAV